MSSQQNTQPHGDAAALVKIALLSMPWAIFNRPSIQLGVLKAFVERERPGVRVDLLHPYVEIAATLGTDQYQGICQDIWMGEALYSPLLFPEQTLACDNLIKQSRRKSGLAPFDPALCRTRLNRHLDDLVDQIDWKEYQLAGFSVCFSQLMASLAAAARLKQAYPHLAVVFGGSSCGMDLGRSLLAQFPQIDFVVSGEGELPLTGLCDFLGGARPTMPSAVLARQTIVPREHGPDPGGDQAPTEVTITDLPMPVYDSYFHEIKRWLIGTPFIPTIPLEFSRGCWWGKCSFCNLNLQWRGYRGKTAEQMVAETMALSDQFACLNFSFTDNALPPKESQRFFAMIAEQHRNFSFFAEVRAIRPPQQQDRLFATYQQGGVTTIQVGIEALSDSLLTRMDKGVTVLDNIATMKDALANNILLEGNLITEFPGSTAAEVDETLQNLDFILPFHPLSIAAFFLGYHSPVERNPKAFNIRARVHHRSTKALLPATVLSGMTMLVMDYRGDRGAQRRRWRPVVDKVAQWYRFHQERRHNITDRPPLSFREGQTFLIIRQERPGEPILHHRLRGTSRSLYLFCRQVKSMPEIRHRFPMVGEPKLKAFFRDLQNKRLLYGANGHYLSLAVQQR